MTYMEKRPYGKPEGLADRLIEHINRLSTDKQLPWVGLGLIDDLRCASEQLRGPTAEKSPETPKMEFDL
jgi:hypothetical protein